MATRALPIKRTKPDYWEEACKHLAIIIGQIRLEQVARRASDLFAGCAHRDIAVVIANIAAIG